MIAVCILKSRSVLLVPVLSRACAVQLQRWASCREAVAAALGHPQVIMGFKALQQMAIMGVLTERSKGAQKRKGGTHRTSQKDWILEAAYQQRKLPECSGPG